MAQNGTTTDALGGIKKEDLKNQKIGNTNYPSLEFAHQSPGGETVVAFNSLVLPSEAISLEGFQNPLPSVLINSKISTDNKANVKLHSSARGELQRFTEFYIREDNQIRLTYTTEENEIITGKIDNVVKNQSPSLDIEKIDITLQIVEGQTIVPIGQDYNVNANPATQMGEIKVYRWRGNEVPKLLVRCEGNNIGNDGNYVESSGQLELKTAGREGGENIVVFSTSAVPVLPKAGFSQKLETIGSQVDAISDFLVDVHNLASNIFQASANQIDLKSFGQKVVDLYGVVFGLVAIPASFLSKLKAVFGVTKSQVKFLAAGTTSTGVLTDLTFNNLVPQKWYRVSLQLSVTSSGTYYVVNMVHDSDVKARAEVQGAQELVYTITRTFKATADKVEFNVLNNGSLGIRGNGTATDTFAQIEELPNHIETTDFT